VNKITLFYSIIIIFQSSVYSQTTISQFSGAQIEQYYYEKNFLSEKGVTSINIFYKEDYEEKCEKSNILKTNKKCNCNDFVNKLNTIIQNSSHLKLNINVYSIDDSYFVSNNNKVSLKHLTALINTDNESILNILSKYKNIEYIKLRDKNNRIPNKIFDYDNKYETSDKSINLGKNWYGLYTSKNENKGGSCPSYDLPKEDLFLNYLQLFIEEVNEQNNIVSKIDNSTIREIFTKIDSLFLVFNFKLEKLTNKFDSAHLQKNIISKNKFSINLSTAALLSGKIKSSSGPYSNQLGINQQPMRFAIDFQYWMNNFRLGLGYAYSSFQFNNNLADSSYSTTWNSSYLGASNQLNVYYKNIQEKISFQNNNLYLLAGYSIPFSNNKLRVDIDASFQYSLPFVVNSKLSNGEFTYRAQVNGIEDEMMNIPELGLVENDLSSRGRESNFKMHGIGFNIGSNLVYSYKNFDIKFGLGYNYNSYTNEKYNENSRMTELVGDYKASLLSSKTISAQFFMLQLALGYTIK
jgi:hypothetical protein